MEKEDYYHYMQKALLLAKRAKGKCSPNPAVGAVLVKGGQIVSEGATKEAGADHAEIVAIKEAKAKGFKDLHGTTMFVTLEPCCFFGRTPPCTNAIIKEGISKVVVGSKDKDPRSDNGGGIRMLKEAGIEVIEIELIEYEFKTLSQEISKLNEDFNKYIVYGLPFCTAKYAMSLDGKIADSNGNSKWISNEKSRYIVQNLRNKTDAIIIGSNTLRKDDPSLTVRLANKLKNPLRIIVSKSLNIPLNSKVLHDEYKTLVVGKESKSKNKNINTLQNVISNKSNKRLIFDPTTNDKNINLRWLLKKLCTEEQITSILLEGGGELLSSFLEYKLIDKVICFTAPKIITGNYTPFNFSVKNIDEAIKLKDVSYKRIGDDMMSIGYLDYG